MSINTNELPADYWENSVETPGYPYRTYINMENFLALLKKASTCW